MFQFTGLMRNPGINARLTATPSLSQPSTSQLLAPRHPPYALICLTTLTHHSEKDTPPVKKTPYRIRITQKATSKNETTDVDDITTPEAILSYYSVTTQSAARLSKIRRRHHQKEKADCKSKFTACKTLRLKDQKRPQPARRDTIHAISQGQLTQTSDLLFSLSAFQRVTDRQNVVSRQGRRHAQSEPLIT